MAKIVRFKNGKYGVLRGGWFLMGYSFLDLVSKDHWWTKPNHIVAYAQGTHEQAKEALESLHDTGEEVKDEG